MTPSSMLVGIDNPYPGLRPFQAAEFEGFFGRDLQIDELMTRLRDHRFVAVVGLSGSGKSSLVRAGLIHRLQVGHLASAGSHWKVATFRPGSKPIEALAAALDDALGYQQDDRTAALRRSTQELLNSTRAGRDQSENLLLVVDQFEEIFRFQRNNQLSNRDAVHFVDLLLAAEQDLSPDYRVYVVLTMRTDYLGDCAQFDGLPEALNRTQYLVPRLTREQTREAIDGPAALTDTAIDSDVMQMLLVESAEGRDTLPLLQHALTCLWEMREPASDSGWKMSTANYQALGGMAKALNDHANKVLDALRPDDRKSLAKKIFQDLTEVGQGRDQRRPQRLSELARRTGARLPEVTAVVEHFLLASFLTSPDRARVDDWEVDITHESLIRQWEMLKKWATEEAQDRDDYLYLAKRVERGGELLTGADLALALKWRDQEHNSVWAERYVGDFGGTVSLIERSQLKRQAAAKQRVIRRIAFAGIIAIALLMVAVYLAMKYQHYQNYKTNVEVTLAKQEGAVAARAITTGLEYARVGNFSGALQQLRLVRNADSRLPLDVLEQAISAGRKNDPALGNLQLTLQYYVASLNLAAVGMNGAILRTEDGGNSWEASDIGIHVDLWSIIFTTPQVGWATAEDATILHTVNGGRNWLVQSGVGNFSLLAVAFVDSEVGWASGGGGTILHTEDGGRTWQKQKSGTGASLGCLSFIDARTGWSAGKGTILHTEDGGRSWHPQKAPTNEYLRSIRFVSSKKGWAVGYTGTILHTEDGGKTWAHQKSGTDVWLYGMSFPAPESGWVVGREGVILHTEDGGRSWNPQISTTKDDLHAISFLTSKIGWAAGDKGTVLETYDGGRNWRAKNSRSDAFLYSITPMSPIK